MFVKSYKLAGLHLENGWGRGGGGGLAFAMCVSTQATRGCGGMLSQESFCKL